MKNGASERAGRGLKGNFEGVGRVGNILALVPFLARPKQKIPFFGLSLLRNQTETLGTQACITGENLIKDQSTFNLMIILLVLITFCLNCAVILLGGN